MNIHKYLPVENYVLESPLTIEEVQERLSNNINTQTHWFGWNARKGDKPYYGTFKENRFSINRVIHYRNSFAPVIKGAISSQHGRTRLHITMKPIRVVRAFMFFWLGAVAIVCVAILIVLLGNNGSERRGFSPPMLIPFAMFIFGWSLLYFAFKAESKISREFLAILFEGVEVSK